MRVYHSLEEVPRPEGMSVVLTMGFFDGVHLGHRKILDRLGQFFDPGAQITGVVTFASHPAEYFAPDRVPKLLTVQKEKLTILGAMNISYILMLSFDKKLVEMPGEQFVEEVLLGRLGVKHMIAGYDTRFGKNRDMDIHKLEAAGKKFGFKVETIQAVKLGGRTISSTAIREMLGKGDAASAEACLGRPYSVEGKVVKGLGLGRRLGIPTANLEIDPQKLFPANGVYAARCATPQGKFKAAVNIGFRPTIPQKSPVLSVEAHLIGFEGDLYDTNITIEFARYIRPEKKFSGVKELVEQMAKDIALAETIL